MLPVPIDLSSFLHSDAQFFFSIMDVPVIVLVMVHAEIEKEKRWCFLPHLDLSFLSITFLSTFFFRNL